MAVLNGVIVSKMLLEWCKFGTLAAAIKATKRWFGRMKHIRKLFSALGVPK